MKVNSILDLIPHQRSAFHVDMKNFPSGKPDFRSVWAHGPARVITYGFKGDVYKKITFKNKSVLYKLRPEIITPKGDFLK